MIEDPRTFSTARLDARLAELQGHAFALYETAAQRADDEPAHRDAYYALAQDEVTPLLATAKRFSDERVRRLRLRARRWRRAAMVILVVGGALIGWLALRAMA